MTWTSTIWHKLEVCGSLITKPGIPNAIILVSVLRKYSMLYLVLFIIPYRSRAFVNFHFCFFPKEKKTV